MKEKIKFDSGTHTVTTKIHKRLGKVARLPGWGWYYIDASNTAYDATGFMRLPRN
jgi:hypothetical protein